MTIFFTSRIFARNKAIPVTLASVASGPEGAALGAGRDFEPPGLEELPDLKQPQVQDALSTMSSAVSSRLALLDDEAFDAELLSGTGRGTGDSRLPRSGSQGIVEKVPREERWEVRFQADSLETYARQLDFFGIELATIGADNKIHYAYNLSKPTPDHRVGPPESESRMYMTWRSGLLVQADRELLTKAGIATSGRILLQFVPAETEGILAAEERQFAGRRDLTGIRKTIFAVKQEGDKLLFHVIDQKYF